MDVTCLRSLALNILKNSYPESIASSIEIPELEPCSICNEELFLHQLKKSFTVLTCGHIFHRLCLENNRENTTICPNKNCVAEIEIIERSPLARMSSQRSMSIDGSQDKSFDPTIFNNAFLDNDPTYTLNFLHLYREITKAETRNEKTKQEVIQCYYNFGELLSQRFYFHYSQVKNDQMAQVEVNKEAREQLPSNISGDAFKKRTERARKVYFLFSQEHIGKEKIGLFDIAYEGVCTLCEIGVMKTNVEGPLSFNEIEANIMELKSKFSKNPSPLFNRLLVDLQGISAYELSWKDPIASQVVSDNSDMIRQLPEDLFNNFMVGDLPSLTR
ncbi:8197_t:CDS:2, partial [Entrophospora sp. SA101]